MPILCSRNEEGGDKSEREAKQAEAFKTIEYYKDSYTKPKDDESLLIKLTKVLIIDDQTEMWNPVWEFILGQGKYDIAANGQDGLAKLREGHKYDCVLLDINLGEESENGIEVLQRIRHEFLDMPVILLTAFDDVEITKMGLRHGANDYFVKEFTDRSNRESILYYEKLKEMLKCVPLWNDPKRIAWRDYKGIAERIKGVDSCYATRIDGFIRKAFFLWRLDKEFILPQKLLSSKKDFSAAVLNIMHALYEIVRAVVSSKEDGDVDFGMLFNQPREDGGFQDILDSLKTSCGISIPDPQKFRRIFINARHSNEQVNSEEARQCFDLLHAIMNHVINSLGVRQAPAEQFDLRIMPIQIEEKKFSPRLSQSSSHEDLAQHGTEIMELWLTNSMDEAKLKINVLYIDDRGEKSAWAPVLTRIFSKVSIISKEDEVTLFNIRGHDIILLDLNLRADDYRDGCEAGLKVLKQIESMNTGIPVVMLSAVNNSYYTRRALFRGAVDFFTKDTVSDPEAYWTQFKGVVDSSVHVKKEEEKVWKELGALKTSVDSCAKGSLRQFSTNIRVGILAPIQTACFLFMLSTRKTLPDEQAIRHLFVEESPQNDFCMFCGTAVEGVVKLLKDKFVQGPDETKPAGWCIDNIIQNSKKNRAVASAYPEAVMKEIWSHRINAKSDHVDDEFDLRSHLLNTINVLQKSLAGVNSGINPFNQQRRGTNRR